MLLTFREGLVPHLLYIRGELGDWDGAIRVDVIDSESF